MACFCGNSCCLIKETIVPLEEVERFAKDCFQEVELNTEQTDIISEIITENEKVGLTAHGLRSIDKYLRLIKNGLVEKDSHPRILKESCATAWVDGCNCLGAIVATYCIKLAIKKAKKVGIGCVVCKGSNEYTSGLQHARRAAEEGLIGFVCSNECPIMPFRGTTKPIFGSNPITVAMPPYEENGLVVNMALTGASKQKVGEYVLHEKPLPENCALDSNGQMTTDPRKAVFLLPLGYPSFDYKGFNLALIIETLTGILGGNEYGPQLCREDKPNNGNLSHCFIVIDPDRFAPGLPCRVLDLLSEIKNSETVNETDITLPGDPERAHTKKVERQNGVTYPRHIMEDFLRIAQTYAVSPLKPLPPLEMILGKI